jgi:hypothetical protein
MTDARFPERWLNDARLQRASAEAFRLFVLALTWSVANRTDGRITVDDLDLIPHATAKDAGELADAGLWLTDGWSDGWTIADYESTQTVRSDLELLDNGRRQDRTRKRRSRHHAAGDHSLCYSDVCPDVRGTCPGDSPVGQVRGTALGQDRTGQDRLLKH